MPLKAVPLRSGIRGLAFARLGPQRLKRGPCDLEPGKVNLFAFHRIQNNFFRIEQLRNGGL